MKASQTPSLRPSRPQRGFILIAVLIVIMLASMIVVSLLFRLRAEETAGAAGMGSEQAWAAAMSGLYEAMRVASRSQPGSLDWRDNPTLFRDHLVVDDGSDKWYFTIYSQGDADQNELRFGLTDEASKLNINQATEEMLEKLPNMTPYLAQGLLDFLDSDDTPRPEGAEQEYYDGLPTPYAVFNGPLATLEELLLVRGFTPALLYGEDANWNFQLDANEDDGAAQFPPDNQDGKLDCGLRQYVTVSSFDLDQDNTGGPRIPLNDTNAVLTAKGQTNLSPAVREDLPPALIAYIEAARRSNVVINQPADLLEATGKFKDENGKDVELESGVDKAELALVLDRFTTRTNSRLPGLININTASSHVLQTLPDVDEALADSMVAARRNLRPEQQSTPAWLYQEGVVDADQLKKLMPFLTARAFQYHFHVLGYGVPSGRYRLLEAIIDTSTPTPTIQYLRDITRLGLPFRIELPSDSTPSEPTDSNRQSRLRPKGSRHA
jgi:DNA uptake protein ComE-like DNA-binding protein/type II secretory pathway pseudopilin PulG